MTEPSVDISARDIRLLIVAAVALYDEYGDSHDILSTSQVETLGRLRALSGDLGTDERLAALSSWDVLSVANTAIELADVHGVEGAELAAAVDRARAYLRKDDE